MMKAMGSSAGERLSVADLELEVIHRGAGQLVLLLHGMQNIDPRARFLDLLGRRAAIIAPSHPGCGRSRPSPQANEAWPKVAALIPASA